MNKTDTQIMQQIAALKAARDAKIDTMTIGDLKKISDGIMALQGELNALLTEGAGPCPYCDNDPIGMRRAKDAATLGVYEVGCIYCDPTKDKTGLRTSISARGFTISEAVENWNAHKWVTDYKD